MEELTLLKEYVDGDLLEVLLVYDKYIQYKLNGKHLDYYIFIKVNTLDDKRKKKLIKMFKENKEIYKHIKVIE